MPCGSTRTKPMSTAVPTLTSRRHGIAASGPPGRTGGCHVGLRGPSPCLQLFRP